MHLKMWTFPFLLLFVGLVSICKSIDPCPARKDVFPCFCVDGYSTSDLELNCFAYKEKTSLEKLRKILTSLSGKKKVQVALQYCLWSEGNVTIPSDFFSGVGVKSLKFYVCKIKGLSTGNQPPLLGLENDLEVLWMERTFMGKNVPFVLNFGHLQKLRKLNIYDNEIKELANDWINAPALEMFSMWKNAIEKIGDRAFANLVNLQYFSFQGDPLPSLQRSMFPNPATKLETLHLSNNRLRSLPEDIFSNMPALREVFLPYNEISTLDQRTWLPVWNQLSVVYLLRFPIKCDESMDWIFAVGKYPRRFAGYCKDRVNERGEEIAVMEYVRSKTQE